MNLRKILWYEARKDGTRDIKIYAYADGKKRYFSTGFKVKEEEWNSKSGTVKKVHPLCQQINSRVNGLLRKIELHLINGGTLDDFQVKDNDGKYAIVKFLKNLIQEGEEGTLGLKRSTVNTYKHTLNRLELYEDINSKKLLFRDINPEFELAFSSFLKKHADCNLPGIGKHMKILKRVMAIAQERGLHKNEAYKSYKVHRGSKSTKVFLTKDEIEVLEQLDLSQQPTLEVERDRFLVSYYFMQRFSDVIRLGQENIFVNNGRQYVQYRSKKTEKEAILPASQKAIDILEKYGYNMNFSSNQQANRELKNICALAGINQMVPQGDNFLPKSRLITTHTARRSAATNLYLEGASLKTIADLGGWKSIEMLRLYLRASGLESAKVASDMDFFN